MKIYLAEGTAEFTLLDHVYAASPAYVFVITLWQDKYLSLLAAEQASSIVIDLAIFHIVLLELIMNKCR